MHDGVDVDKVSCLYSYLQSDLGSPQLCLALIVSPMTFCWHTLIQKSLQRHAEAPRNTACTRPPRHQTDMHH